MCRVLAAQAANGARQGSPRTRAGRMQLSDSSLSHPLVNESGHGSANPLSQVWVILVSWEQAARRVIRGLCDSRLTPDAIAAGAEPKTGYRMAGRAQALI